MMHQEIVEKAKAAQKETNPGAQHKALLDWGEALLNLCVGFLFGEYKRYQQIIEPVERGLYLAATRSVSLGQQWGFVRDIATNLQESALSDLFSKGVKHEQAGEYHFYFKRVKQQCVENPDPSLRIRTGFKDAIAERCRGQSPTPVTKQVFFDEAFIPMRNIYAHPQQTLRKTGEQIEWPLAEEYFGLFNPLLQNSLEEIQKDLESVLVNYQVADLVRKSDHSGEVEQSGKKMDVELPEYLLNETEDETKVIISEQEGQPYVRFYEHEKPGVSAEVRERIVKEESKRLSRALLEQLIHKAFSDDEQIDDTEYFNLKLTSDAAGYTEDELDQLIRKYLKSRGLDEDYEVVDVSGSETIRWNPWWGHYFGLRLAISKKTGDSKFMSDVQKGSSDNSDTTEFYHKFLWDELIDFSNKFILPILNKNGKEWVTQPNSWQIGNLTGYFWNRIYPKKSPIGGIFHIGLFVRPLGKELGVLGKGEIDRPTVKCDIGIDWGRLEYFNANQNIQQELLKFYNDQIKYVIKHFSKELIRNKLDLRFSVVGRKKELRKSRNDGIEISVEEYLKYFDVENIPEDHYFHKLYFRSEDINNIQEIEKSIDISLKLFDRLIENVIDYSVEKGFSIEKENILRKKHEENRSKIVEVIINEENKEDSILSKEKVDSLFQDALTRGLKNNDYNYFLDELKNRNFSLDLNVFNNTFAETQLLESAMEEFQEKDPLLKGQKKSWENNLDRKNRFSSETTLSCGMTGILGIRIGRDNELITICRIEGRTEILDHIIISQTWLSQNPDWELMDNDGKIREDYFEGSKIFGIEWSKQINSSPNSNSEIQSALSEASSFLTQFDEVNSENKFNSNADANS